MAKRGNKKDLFSNLSSAGKMIFSKVLDKVIDNIEEKIINTKKRLMQSIYSSLLVGLGFLSLIGALYYYLTEVLLLSRTQVFLYLGVLLLAIGFFLKYRYLKQKRR